MHRTWCRFGLAGVILLSVFICPLSWAADNSPYGILYPRSYGPYQSVFKSVIHGVESKLNGVAKYLATEDEDDLNKASDWVKQNEIEVLVTLGKPGLDLCKGLATEVQLIAGAILSPPEEGCQIKGGIALAPHPTSLFNALLTLNPGIKTVYVVFSPDFNDWLMEYARKAAELNSINLIAHPANSLEQAAKLYRGIINTGLGRSDAIWLPQDPYTVDQKTVLSVLLRESWKHNFVVFSSNAAHVKRGVLFGLYPDFKAMGASLGEMALQVESDGEGVKNSAIQPLTDVLIAVNLRTADHLKLNLKKSVRDSFDLTFPASH